MRREVGDKIFFVVLLTVVITGFAIFASATLGLLARESNSVSRDIMLQAGLGLGLGFIALFVAQSISLTIVRKASPYIYVMTLILTALVFMPGIGLSAHGATRWIDVGVTTFQPAEFLKIGYVLMIAWWLAPNARLLSSPKKGIIPMLFIIIPAAALLLAQPNTSTTILLVITGAAMYFVAGAPLRDFGTLLLIGVIVIGALISFRPYALQRISTFFDPSANSLSSGYQIQQSLIAIGSGQIIGRGFGQSVEKFNYLPEPGGDSVFAVFAEETGFIGASILIALFLGLTARGIVIAGNSRELFGGLIAFGFAFLIITQTFINVCAMLGLIPLTGLPLPFVSHGGTALLAVLMMCGFILNVASHRRA